MPDTSYPRHAEARLRESLADSPVVLIQGPRQCGKTTLAQTVGLASGYEYISFDDRAVCNAAEADPGGFVDTLPPRVVLDEAQKAPGIFSAVKLSVDRERAPGRFILTGSVNVLQVRAITDSLAGRMDIIELHPFSQCELARAKPGFLDALFSSRFRMRRPKTTPQQTMERVAAGGYPAALQRAGARQRAWYQSYIDTLVQHDVPGIANIRSPEILLRLLTLAAAQTAQLLSVNNLSSSFQISRNTVESYLALLAKMFLLERVPAWHSNRKKRLIKTPKLHLGDTGVACALLNLSPAALASDAARFGHMLETFVLQELRRQASAHPTPHRFFHYREKDGKEVDIVIERDAFRLAGVEVKASATVGDRDFRSLRKLKAAAGRHFAGGALLYRGARVLSFGDGMHAVPLRALWDARSART